MVSVNHLLQLLDYTNVPEASSHITLFFTEGEMGERRVAVSCKFNAA